MKAKRCNLRVTKQEKNGPVLEIHPLIGVFEHEKLLLEEIHGPGSTEEFDWKEMELKGKKGRAQWMEQGTVVHEWPVVLIDEEPEHSRLMLKYGKHPTIDTFVVERVFGQVSEGRLAAFGEAKYKGIQGIDEFAWEEKENEKLNGKGEEGWKRKFELSNKTLAQLRNHCREQDIHFTPGDTKGSILEKIMSHERGVGV